LYSSENVVLRVGLGTDELLLGLVWFVVEFRYDVGTVGEFW